ncbi:MAG: alpha/beta fold hydrolase [Herpetosiphonaceae bacterium]|nr:alpha/beta fold hydrolase [Herpetosiphonaceae bacterium]
MSLITHRLPGLVLTDHEFRVPLDYTQPEGEQLMVFAREVVAPSQEQRDLPWLVFFQGGPGGKSPRPDSRNGWLKRATEEYRVLLLDQRGTGRSTPVNEQTLSRRGTAEAQAEYLMHFRADAIIRDAEHIRGLLLGPEGRWSVLGQSYGGFCVVTYLSFAPEGLREAFITGGLPPLAHTADEIYHMTYRRVLTQNLLYFARYPDDQTRAQAIVAYLRANDVRLPNDEQLTPHRFQTLGMGFGMSDGFEELHYLLEEAFVEGASGPELSQSFLYSVMSMVTFAGRPLYAVLHEPIYSQGVGPHWAAERVRTAYGEFVLEPGKPVYFTGEMIYPWMFAEDSTLRPLAAAAELLAQHDSWSRLYDAECLQHNTVPCAAAIYYDDMYVERVVSEETARTIAGCRVWVTNEFQHNGLRADGELILGRLIAMVRGER